MTSKRGLSKVNKIEKIVYSDLQSSRNFFMDRKKTRLKCPRVCPKPGKRSAHRSMAIHCVEQKVRNENLA